MSASNLAMQASQDIAIGAREVIRDLIVYVRYLDMTRAAERNVHRKWGITLKAGTTRAFLRRTWSGYRTAQRILFREKK